MSYCLVVEDSQEVRHVLCRILSELGHHPLEADGPAAGADICRTIAPPIIFLDWDLPDFGALDFLRVIPHYERRPQIVLCMATNERREFALAKAAGATVQLMKPFDKAATLRAIERVEDAIRETDGTAAPEITGPLGQDERLVAT